MRGMFDRCILFAFAFTITLGPPSMAVAQITGSAGAPSFSFAFGEAVGFQSQDNSAGTTDQATKPAEPKGGTTLIGCLSGPDSDGKFTLRSMSHRTGVEVFGPGNLKDDSGSKVKL